MTLRDFNPEQDYEKLAALHNAVWPDYPVTVEELQSSDAQREAKLRHHRLLVEKDGHVVAQGRIGQSSWTYHPQKFYMGVDVHPDFRQRGIGKLLLAALEEKVADTNPIQYGADTREDKPESLGFLAKHGFVECMRAWESRLNVASVDLAPFAEARQKPLAHGLRLVDLATLLEEEGEDAYVKLHDMEMECDADVPLPEGEKHTPMTYDAWREMIRKSVRFTPECQFIAVAPDGQYAGISMLFPPKIGDYLSTGLTGVRRAYRRKGIALALKCMAVEYAKAKGVPEIRTDNAQSNRAMLSINEALGFEKQPAWIMYEKRLGGESSGG
ncbi:GNAT family N-acetyltransferase [Armatimonas rosea]|uniref:GNAT superfamily N-acetyltransferase n=1 Tax=Armatimonas rosea TaxID=685828 RepID=A0A7W9W4F1_ARMRO|nr:GNAT family N-acetyltransferase [Armatimonas rosea]MBB6049369.1 GNAT superfamily N-acetyltransferase [Armatimonas rosea]